MMFFWPLQWMVQVDGEPRWLCTGTHGFQEPEIPIQLEWDPHHETLSTVCVQSSS